MSLHRAVAWLVAALAGVAAGPAVSAGPVVSAAPAAVADYEVSLRSLPVSFRAGGPPETATITLRSDESDEPAACIVVRRVLTVRLDGLDPGQVRVQSAAVGAWLPAPVQAIADGVRVTDVAPMCRVGVLEGRYRIAFLPGAPAGRVRLVAEVFNGRGDRLGGDNASRRVIGVRANRNPARIRKPTPAPSRTPTPTPTASAEPSATPTSTPTEAGVLAGTVAAAAASPVATAAESDGFDFGLGAAMTVIGVLLIGIGAALLIMLLPLRREARRNDDHGGPGGDATSVLPTVPG